MTIFSESGKNVIPKVGFTDDEYKVFFDLLDKLNDVDTGRAETSQNRASLDALITYVEVLSFIATDEQILPGMNKLNNHSKNNSTREANLASQIVVESFFSALNKQMRNKERSSKAIGH